MINKSNVPNILTFTTPDAAIFDTADDELTGVGNDDLAGVDCTGVDEELSDTVSKLAGMELPFVGSAALDDTAGVNIPDDNVITRYSSHIRTQRTNYEPTMTGKSYPIAPPI